jgi:hypothetical protein
MNGRVRVKNAMEHKEPDRVPVFCQLSLGHYMLNTPYKPHRIWYSSAEFSDALITLAKRYHFDGILVNLPGRQPDWQNHIESITTEDNETKIVWNNGDYSICPHNDNAHYFAEKRLPSIDEVDPDKLFYIEPHDISEVTYPYYYGFAPALRPLHEDFFPDYVFSSFDAAVEKSGGTYHVSGEIFSPFSQLMELFGYSDALVGLVQQPEKIKVVLERFAEGAATYGYLQSLHGIDALLVSSAFAGGGFISTQHYREFVLPYEKKVVDYIHRNTELPVYVHTCGAIGDRINVMLDAGYDGVDTMDPPPLGNTDIAEVKTTYGDRLFLKGNIDPVNVLLHGSVEDVYNKACYLVKTAGVGGGYILSSACSVAPSVAPENILQLYRASVDHPYQM